MRPHQPVCMLATASPGLRRLNQVTRGPEGQGRLEARRAYLNLSASTPTGSVPISVAPAFGWLRGHVRVSGRAHTPQLGTPETAHGPHSGIPPAPLTRALTHARTLTAPTAVRLRAGGAAVGGGGVRRRRDRHAGARGVGRRWISRGREPGTGDNTHLTQCWYDGAT
jgi:hypothetical protein